MKRLAVAAFLVLSVPAVAQELVIPAELGDEGGCVRAKGGTPTTDSVVILRRTEIQQYESACEYLDVKQSRMGPQVVRALCSGEGFFWTMEFVVADVGDGNYVVSFGGERPEVTVRQCG
jgi:hypothetical protein